MCLTYFFINDPDLLKYFNIKFLLLFNREEKILRNTLPLDHFSDDPNIIGGRDKKEGGTWLGLNTKTGNIAFLTNYE